MRMLFAAAAALVLTAGPALALDAETLKSERNQVVQVAVSTHDVDFRNQASVDRFYHRLQRAARQACDSRSAVRVLQQEDRACAREALNISVASLSRPMLTARHDASGPAFATGW